MPVEPTVAAQNRSSRAVSAHALRSEWTKLWTVRTTSWTFLIAIAVTVGLSALSSWGVASGLETLPAQARAGLPSSVTISLTGTNLGLLVIVVLGVLVISSEYRTGMIRSSLVAVPQRIRFLIAKLLPFTLVALVSSEIMVFASFFAGQSFFTAPYAATLSDAEVLRAVFGAGLFITAGGVFGLAVGALVRNVAGSIAIAIGAVLILPPLLGFLPGEWGDAANKYFLTNAGRQVMLTSGDPATTSVGPWLGYGILWAWIAAVLLTAAFLLHKRDA